MKLSIIIPAYNEEKSISKTIKSVLNSSYKNFEIIVVDNGSTDRTKKVVKSFNNNKIKYFYYEKKRGPAAARNYGAKKSKGELLFFLDADDWFEKETLKILIKNVKDYPKINIFLLPRINIFEKGFKKVWSFEFFSYINHEKNVFKKKLEIQKRCIYCPYVFKKYFFNKIKGFNDKIYYYEDEYLKNKIIKLNEPCLLIKDAKYYTNMGSSFNDFFKRSKNLGKGIVSLKDFKKIIYLILVNFSFIFLFNPIIMLIYFSFSFFYWYSVSKSLYISFLAPFLWVLKKIIGLYYMIIHFLKA
jgi:glycosyltransferase involved in cell wall biosynthesis